VKKLLKSDNRNQRYCKNKSGPWGAAFITVEVWAFITAYDEMGQKNSAVMINYQKPDRKPVRSADAQNSELKRGRVRRVNQDVLIAVLKA